MMRQILIILTALIFFTACNNNNEKTSEEAELNYNSEKEIKDAISKFPDSLLLKEKLIQYYRDSAAYDRAIITVNEALQKDSFNTRLWEIKATLHFEDEDTVNAIRSFETALQILPLPGYIMTLGSLYAQTKNIRALDMADALLQNKTTNTKTESLFIKGYYFSNTGDKIKAIGYFDNCLALDHNYMLAYREKAIALYDLGKYEDAVNVLTKAITLQNRFDEGYYWRGRCLEKLNNPTYAIEDYRMALMYSPDYTEAKEALARLGTK